MCVTVCVHVRGCAYLLGRVVRCIFFLLFLHVLVLYMYVASYNETSTEFALGG